MVRGQSWRVDTGCGCVTLLMLCMCGVQECRLIDKTYIGARLLTARD